MHANRNGRTARRCGVRRGTPSPLFFVSIASKGFRFPVSLLESMLAGNAEALILKEIADGDIG